MVDFRKENERKAWVLLTPILLIAFTLRLTHIADFSLFNDELSAWVRLPFPDLQSLLQHGVRVDGHPAATQVILYYWTALFGDSPYAMRFPFALMASFSVLFAFLFTKRIIHSNAALFVAAALALLEFPLLYSCLARPYASGQLFAMLNAWAWALFLFPNKTEEKGKLLKALFLGFTFALQLYNHYFSALLALLIGFSGFFFLKRQDLKYYLLAALFATLLYLPHVPISLYQFSIGGVGEWLGAPNYNWPFLHLLHIFNGSLPLAVIILLIVKASLKKGSGAFNLNKTDILLLSWFAIPLLIGFVYSKWVNPVLQNSVLIFSMPFLLMFIFSRIPRHISHRSMLLLFAMTGILSIHAFVIDDFRNKQHFEEFADIPIQLTAMDQEFGQDKICKVVHTNNIKYLRYFGNGMENQHFEQEMIRTEEDLLKLREVLRECDKDYFSITRIQYCHPIAWDMVRARYPYSKKRISYDDLSVVELFSKQTELRRTDSSIVLAQLKSINDTTELEEYGQSLEYFVNKTSDKCKLRIVAEGFINCEQVDPELTFVMQSSDEDGKSIDWKGIPLKYFLDEGVFSKVHIDRELRINKDTHTIKLYLWNPNRDKTSITNLRISVLKASVSEDDN